MFNTFFRRYNYLKIKNPFFIFILFFLIYNTFLITSLVAQKEDISLSRVFINQKFLSNIEKPKPEVLLSKSSLVYNAKYFYVINFKYKRYDAVFGILKAVTQNAKIWVDTIALANNYITQKEIDDIAKYLETMTYEKSKSNDLGIIPLLKTYFGEIPNVNENREKGQGDGKINILITDIQDNYDESGEYIPGYFNYEDVDKGGFISNKMDLIYIDCYPGIFYQGARNIHRALPSIAHELQHLIHWNYDSYETTFINESMSIVAEFFCGFKVDLPEASLSIPNMSLFSWDEEYQKVNESRAALFGVYLREQCGDDFLKFLISNKAIESAGIDSAIKVAGLKNISFEQLFTNWTIANYVNDKLINSKYGYSSKLLNKPVIEKTHYEPNVLSNYVSVNHLAPVYIKYTKAESLNITFRFNTNVIVKALEIGNSKFNVYDISANYNYVQNNFGTLYKDIVFVCINLNKFGNDPQYVSYFSSGKKQPSFQEIAYDDGEPETYGLSTEIGVKRFVKFRMPAGKRLDSVKFAFKTTGKALFHIYRSTDTSVYAIDNIISPIMLSVVDTFPIWTKIDLVRFNIIPEYDLAIGYEILPSDAPHPLLWGDITNVKDRSIAYFPSTGLWYSINTNYLIRAYVSDYFLSLKKVSDIIPEEFVLFQNYPNPFNNETNIKFNINRQSHIKLKLYDLLGKEVICLLDENLNPGTYIVKWNGKNKYAVNVPSGLYIYSLESDKHRVTKKMLYLK